MIRQNLYIALRMGMLERNASILHDLLLQHGAPTFANALSHGSARVIADALSLLPLLDRVNVLRHLPSDIRAAMLPLCAGGNQRVRRLAQAARREPATAVEHG